MILELSVPVDEPILNEGMWDTVDLFDIDDTLQVSHEVDVLR